MTTKISVRGWCDADFIETLNYGDLWTWVLVDKNNMSLASGEGDGWDMELEALQNALNCVMDRDWLAERGL